MTVNGDLKSASCQKRALFILLMLLILNASEFKLECNVTGMMKGSGRFRACIGFLIIIDNI